MCGLFYLRSCAGGTEENGVGEFQIFWDFWEILDGMNWFEFKRERKIFGFLGNLSFLGFKRDVDHYIFFFKCNIY